MYIYIGWAECLSQTIVVGDFQFWEGAFFTSWLGDFLKESQ